MLLDYILPDPTCAAAPGAARKRTPAARPLGAQPPDSQRHERSVDEVQRAHVSATSRPWVCHGWRLQQHIQRDMYLVVGIEACKVTVQQASRRLQTASQRARQATAGLDRGSRRRSQPSLA